LPKPLFIPAVILTASACAIAASASLRHGVVWYAAAPDEATRALAAERYDLAISGKGGASDADKAPIRALNPGFEWFVYNSVSDNYVPPARAEEHDRLAAVARRRGVDVEALYLHYYEDTRIVLGGDTLDIPGWGEGSARDPSQARVPVYDPGLTRRVTCFADPGAARVHREAIVSRALDEPFPGTGLYPDGIFLDNAAARIFNTGKVIRGGAIREVPGHARIGSGAFRGWYWENNLGPFLAALRETLASSATWSRDGRRKRLMINVANVWEDDYARRHVADILFLEYQYSPIRNAGLDAVEESHRRDVLAASAGMVTFYAATPGTRSVQGRPYAVDYGEALLGNLAWYLVSRTSESILFQMGTNTPNTAGWDTLTWRGCMEVADRQLGDAVGEPFTLSKGLDPAGQPFVVTARRYERGLVAVRPRGSWREGIEPETAVSVDLPVPLSPVSASGTVGKAVTAVRLRNGQGIVLLGDPGPR
jgi:hypothetical protein